MASQQCIIPNPDISGIGVRVAIYVQSLLLAIQTYKVLFKEKIDEEEEQLLESSWTNSMLFTIGIVLSAIIQAGLGNLSIHHGLVTLNLCWLIIVSELPSMGVVLVVFRLKATTMFKRRRRWRDNMKTIVSIHVLRVILWYTLGLVVWASVNPADPCTRLTDYVIMFKYAISLAVAVIVILGAIIFAVIFKSKFESKSKSKSKPRPSDSDSASQDSINQSWDASALISMGLGITLFTFYQVYFIACTEIMVKKNAQLLIGGEAQEDVWTFGQTLALLMLSAPLLEFMSSLREEKKERGEDLNSQPGAVEGLEGQAKEDQAKEVDSSRVGV